MITVESGIDEKKIGKRITCRYLTARSKTPKIYNNNNNIAFFPKQVGVG